MPTLRDISYYRKEVVPYTAASIDTFISTENMLPDKMGVTSATAIPTEGNLSKYYAGDILVSNIRPYFKKIWKAENEGACSNDILVFKSKDNSDDYLYWLLSSNTFFAYMSATAIGTKMPRGDKRAIMNFQVPKLTNKQQTRIVEVLNPLKQKIELNTQINDYLEEWVETYFEHCFIEEEARFTTEKVPLREVADISVGADKPQITTATRTTATPIPIFSNGTNNEGLYGYTAKARILKESVTVSARGTIGYVCWRNEPYFPIVRLVCVVPNSYVTAKYLYLYLKRQFIQGVGTTQQQLTAPAFSRQLIQIPNEEAMQNFSATCDSVFKLIASNKSQRTDLAVFRDTLLPKLMSGEIDVSQIDTTHLNNDFT